MFLYKTTWCHACIYIGRLLFTAFLLWWNKCAGPASGRTLSLSMRFLWCLMLKEVGKAAQVLQGLLIKTASISRVLEGIIVLWNLLLVFLICRPWFEPLLCWLPLNLSRRHQLIYSWAINCTSGCGLGSFSPSGRPEWRTHNDIVVDMSLQFFQTRFRSFLFQ